MITISSARLMKTTSEVSVRTYALGGSPCSICDPETLDSFHLYGLKKMFNRFNDALEMILDPECPDDEELEDEK